LPERDGGPSGRSAELGVMDMSWLEDTSTGKSTGSVEMLGVVGGGVDSIARELVLEGDERVGFDLEDWY
jgi:hypothetical protein